MQRYIFVFLSGYLWGVTTTFAAPCCNGSTSLPTMITGDDRAQLNLSVSQAAVIGDVPAEGLPVFRNDATAELSARLSMEGAVLISDRWQAGLSVPFLMRRIDSEREQARSAGLGDLLVNTDYEFLPEHNYSRWKPKGFAFFQITLPTGHALLENSAASSVEATGKGFFILTAGTLWFKHWNAWDLSFIPEIHWSIPRTFHPSTDTTQEVSAGWGTSVTLAGGYSWQYLRLGLSLAPSVNQAHRIENNEGVSYSAPQWVWDVTAQASTDLTEGMSLALVYGDQTLLGPARNTTLSRSLTLQTSLRWPR